MQIIEKMEGGFRLSSISERNPSAAAADLLEGMDSFGEGGEGVVEGGGEGEGEGGTADR